MPLYCVRPQLENMPASAQDIPDPGEADRDQGITLRLYQCRSCGLAQFDCEPVGYYRDVIRSGGYSTTMRELRTSQYRHLIETYGLEGKKFLEAGCGQGEFLDMLKDFPVKAFGQRTLSWDRMALTTYFCPLIFWSISRNPE